MQYKKRIVVKVGTNVMVNRDKRLVHSTLKKIVRQISELYEEDIICILVSSGSIIAGKELIYNNTITNKDIREQVFSAVGQPRLMRYYYNLFASYGMRCAQVLGTKYDFTPGEHRDNMLNCFEGLLSLGVIPIVNEDDVTSLREIKFSDNDELASNVAVLIQADLLLLLSDIDGVYTGNPAHPASQKLTMVQLDENVEQYIQKSTKGEGEGRGGMKTKIRIAKETAEKGIPTIIACGKADNVILDSIKGKKVGTQFLTPDSKPVIQNTEPS